MVFSIHVAQHCFEASVEPSSGSRVTNTQDRGSRTRGDPVETDDQYSRSDLRVKSGERQHQIEQAHLNPRLVAYIREFLIAFD
jgi:hypothetical protein